MPAPRAPPPLSAAQDVCASYRRPCVMDVKIGYRTWYDWADPAYIAKCREKDGCTSQGRLGFRLCGARVWRRGAREWQTADRHWGKGLDDAAVAAALRDFAA